MLLDTINKSLGLTGAVGLISSVEYEDTNVEKVVPAQYLVTIAAGDNVIAPQPTDGRIARRIKEINIYNGGAATHDVDIYILDNSTKYLMKSVTALAVKATLHYSIFNGWTVTTA
jgi:hypothetical protein